ncbi:DUF6445 family protein [Thetidibacter halocola]|uniref:Uncharacterized protein n=1 Tax=Thetidibacter halocola TaxID=2827239 RepID=A0A8J7WGQ3_9RHOB|nr:DUF6445 family protein [Thetidibacter halocola]MBS0124704.1 hypothetical protein [Thetidibacter halocola]
MERFAANRALKITVVPMGRLAEPVMVIDDFLADPQALVAAARASDWRELPPGGYPGRRAGLPRDYVRCVLQRLDGPIRKTLLRRPSRLDTFDCSFSMVTRAPADLAPLQRVPHIDVANAGRVAILHYLCGPQFGGTAFFRQDATGLEQIRPAEKPRYLAARAQGLEALGPDNRYPDADTPGYERTGFTEARFNRLVAYRSFTLHSGIVEDPAILTDDPATGRLTANFFVDYAEGET